MHRGRSPLANQREPADVGSCLASRVDCEATALGSRSRRPGPAWRGATMHLKGRLSCWRSLAVPLLQTALAAGLSWFVAVRLFGHVDPLFAPVAAIVSIDMTLGRRLRRAIELIVGASVGVGIGALLLSAIGTGAWQIAVVVGLATSVAVLLNGRAVINVLFARRSVCPAAASGTGARGAAS